MAIFKLFNKKQEENEQVIPEVTDSAQSNVQSDESDSQNENEDEKKRMITITWGTGMPIDVIFNYIHKNFEEDGYQDALINQDITYRDSKITIIRNDLEMLSREYHFAISVILERQMPGLRTVAKRLR